MSLEAVSTTPEHAPTVSGPASTAAEGVNVVAAVSVGKDRIAPKSASTAPEPALTASRPTSTTPEPTSAAFSTWGGHFSFTNQLGKDITSGNASHWTTDFGVQTIQLDGLGNGQTTQSLAFVTSTTNTDRWAFNATLTDGSRYEVKEQNCGFETEDAGKTVKLQAIIAASTKSFYIAMPESSNCSISF